MTSELVKYKRDRVRANASRPLTHSLDYSKEGLAMNAISRAPHRDRLFARTVTEDRGYITPCFIWQGSTTLDGYAEVKIQGKKLRAHRVIYAEVVGDIPDGYHIDHLCHVVGCINPDHLEPVTLIENNRRRRMAQKTETHCARGHDASNRNKYGDCRICKRDNERRRCHERTLRNRPTGMTPEDGAL